MRTGWLAVLNVILIASLGLYSNDYKFSQEVQPFTILDENGENYDLSFTGGFNRPVMQFLDVDLDQDFDLVIQDQPGVLTLFRNVGTPQQPEFVWDGFPYSHLEIGEWFKFVDADGDGDHDLFAENPYGIIRYYKNSLVAAVPTYTLLTDTLRDISGEALFSDGFSIPGWADINCDGDLEMFLGRTAGTIALYEPANLEMDQAPVYELITDTWQDLTILTGGGSPNPANPPNQFNRGRHGINSLAFFDVDNDNDFDIFWGDFYAESIIYIENEGSCNQPLFLQDNIVDQYPPNDPVQSGGFNVPYFVDIDADGDEDMFVAVFGGSLSMVSNSKNNFLFYENTGVVGQPNFELRTTEYIYTLDLGQNTTPEFADYDHDGDLDIFVANQEDLNSPNNGNSRVYLIMNDGTPTNPVYSISNTHCLNVDIPYDLNYSPELADIDGDGIDEMFVGTFEGTIAHYAYTGEYGNELFEIVTNEFFGIDAGNYAAPEFGDIDADGDFDLLIGNFAGKIQLYENIGSPTEPNFVFRTDNYADITIYKHSVPALGDINGDGDLDLLVGTLRDGATLYRNVGTEQEAKFVADTTFSPGEFHRMAPTLADIDADGDVDILSGTTSGGLVFYENIVNPADFGVQVEPPYIDLGTIHEDDEITLEIPFFNRGTDIAAIVDIQGNQGSIPGEPVINAIPDQATFQLQPREKRTVNVTLDLQGSGDIEFFIWTEVSVQGWLPVHVQGYLVGESDPEPPVASTFDLQQNYPNPFNGETHIEFDIPATENMNPHELAIFNVLGQLVRSWEIPASAAGFHDRISWDGSGTTASQVTSGLYFYRLQINDGTAITKKLLLVH